MIHLNSDFYDDLAQEIITAVCDQGKAEGVIELQIETKNKTKTEVLFAFNSVDYTLANGLRSMNYLMLAFEGGVRVSTDFDADRLSSIIEEN